MSRPAIYTLIVALSCIAPLAQASVLDELGQSLLSGPSPDSLDDYSRVVPVSELSFGVEPGAMPNHLAPEPDSDQKSPSLFVMPVGRSDEVGIGVGVRFPF